jgi:zinc D-Ala-D-Ala dipeptidase
MHDRLTWRHFIPGIALDIGYATTNNFTGEKIYNLPLAYAH